MRGDAEGELQLELTSDSPETTQRIGRILGERLRGGEIIVLESDLGGGKTELTKGIALGLDSDDAVSSPTFTVEQIYHGKTLELHHYDFYRLGEMGVMSEEMTEVLADPQNVCVIEWPEAALDLLPPERLIHIVISKDSGNETTRHLTLVYPANLTYAVEPTMLKEVSK